MALVALVAASCAISFASPHEPKEAKGPKPPGSTPTPDPVRGRAVYLGMLQEVNGVLFPANPLDDQLVYQAIKWASGKTTGPYTVHVLDSQETITWGLWSAWTNFMLVHPDVIVTNTEADPILYADYVLGNYDVLLIGNAWHGDPLLVPAPSPGAKSWVFTDQEIADISQWVKEGHGLIVTGGSFGQFARDPTFGYNNYKLASLMCLRSTGGGVPSQADAFPWSRNSSFYPPIRPPAPTLVDFYNDAPAHPIMAGLPLTWVTAPNNAMAQWMSIIPGSGGVQLGHYGVGPDQYQDSLNTACVVAP